MQAVFKPIQEGLKRKHMKQKKKHILRYKDGKILKNSDLKSNLEILMYNRIEYNRE